MMGSKQRQFAPLIHVSLEELVPVDHFYRHLERRQGTALRSLAFHRATTALSGVCQRL